MLFQFHQALNQTSATSCGRLIQITTRLFKQLKLQNLPLFNNPNLTLYRYFALFFRDFPALPRRTRGLLNRCRQALVSIYQCLYRHDPTLSGAQARRHQATLAPDNPRHPACPNSPAQILPAPSHQDFRYVRQYLKRF